MKRFVLAWILCWLSAGAAVAYVVHEDHRLQTFCAAIPLGSTVSEVRKSAQKQGFETEMEPFVQMKVRPTHWVPAPFACRVIFNRDDVVELRRSERS
jgi:hypothetical protein